MDRRKFFQDTSLVATGALVGCATPSFADGTPATTATDRAATELSERRAPAPAVFYLIPGCYLGNIPPDEHSLREGCSLDNLRTVRP